MSDLNKLDNGSYKHIQEVFNKIMAYSQGMNVINTDDLFQNWEKNKKYFRQLLGNELIYIHPIKITIDLDQEALEKKFDKLIASFYFSYPDLNKFLRSNELDFIGNNKLSTSYQYKDIIIPAGMKITKAFKYFIKDSGDLRAYQDKASQFIQQKRIEGYFCLSIHPLDYISISENTNNWRSCHALDGEYRSGNLNYMSDNCTLIAYIIQDPNKKYKLPNFPSAIEWNSKCWRTLLFFSQDQKMIFASGQYPFESDEILDTVLNNVLIPLFPKIPYQKWLPWQSNVVKTIPGLENVETYSLIPMDHAFLPIASLMKNCDNALFYNDILHSNTNLRYTYQLREFSWKIKHLLTSGKTNFLIGHPVKCLRCQETIIEIPDSPYCLECEIEYGHSENENYFTSCDHCGCGHIYVNNVNRVNDEEYWCEDCMEDEDFITCEKCGEVMTLTYAESGEHDCEWI